MHPVLEHHPRSLGDVRFGPHTVHVAGGRKEGMRRKEKDTHTHTENIVYRYRERERERESEKENKNI